MYRIAAGSRNIPVLNITKLRVVSRHVVTKTCAWTVKNRAPKLIVTGFQIFVNKSDISEKSFLKFLFKIIKHWFIRIKICHRVNHFIFSNIWKTIYDCIRDIKWKFRGNQLLGIYLNIFEWVFVTTLPYNNFSFF